MTSQNIFKTKIIPYDHKLAFQSVFQPLNKIILKFLNQCRQHKAYQIQFHFAKAHKKSIFKLLFQSLLTIPDNNIPPLILGRNSNANPFYNGNITKTAQPTSSTTRPPSNTTTSTTLPQAQSQVLSPQQITPLPEKSANTDPNKPLLEKMISVRDQISKSLTPSTSNLSWLVLSLQDVCNSSKPTPKHHKFRLEIFKEADIYNTRIMQKHSYNYKKVVKKIKIQYGPLDPNAATSTC